MSIRLSEKHGLNPSITVCFFCGKDKDIMLFGRLKGDAKAPERIMANYEPCDECKEKMALGTTLVEVTEEDNGSIPIAPGLWPTSRWMVISNEAAKRMFGKHHKLKMLVDHEIFQAISNKRS